MPAPTGALGPHSLRGLAHPLRVRMLALLREHGASTATRLAERLGESSGTTSYHLRQLAAYGFVEDVPGRAAGRERWWRPVVRRNDNAGHLRAAAADGFQRLHEFLGAAAELQPEWQPAVGIGDHTLRLTPAQAVDLLSRIGALVSAYSADEPGGPGAGTEQVVVQWQVFPRFVASKQASRRDHR
ncbi:ArsR/SmtB family transcription factor [Actinoplanes siamensis]|uniref:Transcriptional regulator n=1 Tax=Actinoplanes siamensis TaxID=1223317 RepID=A0A919NA22_9ACTN|nr:winged helix-turn-helix domain-containing protein [Actinoplanes siamensis]GIF07241.1 transcriptional regulator [Actinoplanes siamensis]